ncbi:ATP-binding protein [Alkalihalophilus marmarensis]|uniref:ATP-binding protein n=1 Tax=Alkalihalophilus marmarensis TaxID=521377 RepID=UPI00204093F7|nr:ATP-binding protein [Alkalihalophilus marmarensis]
MRQLFKKLFNGGAVASRSGIPALPKQAAYREMEYQFKRGFIAREISAELHYEPKKGNELLFLSFLRPKGQNNKKRVKEDSIFLLSEHLLDWGSASKDVEKEIERLSFPEDVKNAVRMVYLKHKDALFEKSSTECKKAHDDTKSTAKEWAIYRDVIFAATQGKLKLIEKDEVQKYEKSDVLYEGMVQKRADIPYNRQEIRKILEQKDINQTKMMNWLLVISEGITNIIKHAEEGRVTLYRCIEREELYAVIEDKGPGFPLDRLPNMTLFAGYSSKESLGQGFTLMTKMTKQVLLYTSPIGSTIILTFDL